MLTNHEITLDTDNIDERDPTGTYLIGSFDPSYVGCLPFDPMRRYPPQPEVENESLPL